MARKPKDKGSRKFGAPLYCAAWPLGAYPVVGGGGGKRSSGIPNRIVLLKREHGVLAENEQGNLRTAETTPFNMCLHPDGQTVVVGLGSAGLQVLELLPQASGPPGIQFAQETASQREILHSFADAKGLAFSSNGKLLAVGLADAVHVHEWPSLVHVGSIRRGKQGLPDAVRDIDFSRAHAHNRVIAVTCEDGSCTMWLWDEQQCVEDLVLPKEFVGGAFKACRFARDGSKGLFTVVNHQGLGYILHWQQDDQGEMQLLQQTAKGSFAAPITAFDISSKGTFLGTGTSEGDVASFLAQDLSPLQKVKGAHMVFTTALAFSQDEHSMLTVSADASALATKVSSMPASTSSRLYVFLAILICFIALVASLWFPRVERHSRSDQTTQPLTLQQNTGLGQEL